MRAWSNLAAASSPESSLDSSSMALSWASRFASSSADLLGRLAGGEGRLSIRPARAVVCLVMVFRLPPLAIGIAPPCSLSRIAAARAATLAPGVVIDFRRVIRCVGLRAPARRECECELVRAWDWRPGRAEDAELDMGERWCVNGLVEGCISCGRTTMSAKSEASPAQGQAGSAAPSRQRNHLILLRRPLRSGLEGLRDGRDAGPLRAQQQRFRS